MYIGSAVCVGNSTVLPLPFGVRRRNRKGSHQSRTVEGASESLLAREWRMELLFSGSASSSWKRAKAADS